MGLDFISMHPAVRVAAAALFPAGFAAAAPFLAELLAHLPFAVVAPDYHDRYTQLFDAANAGSVGRALGPYWIALELLLLHPGVRRLQPSTRALGAALLTALALPPLIHLLAGFPISFRWTWWGTGLGVGLAVARASERPQAIVWVLSAALVTMGARHLYGLWVSPGLAWTPLSWKPLIAGGLAGLIVRSGWALGRRWGPESPPARPGAA
jgi:hypothetical protein